MSRLDIIVLWLLVVACVPGLQSAYGYVSSEQKHFIRDYFSQIPVSVLVILSCSATDSHKLVKFLSSSSKMWIFAAGVEQLPATLDSIAQQTFYRTGVYLDYTCLSGVNTLFLNSEREYLNGSHHWLVSSDSPQVPREVDKLRLRLDSELVWATRENGTITLHDLYKIDHNWPVVRTVAGSWHVSTGLRYNLTQWKYHASRRGDLQGANLLGGLVLSNIPHENIDEEIMKPESRVKDVMAVFSYIQNVHLREIFNFTVTVMPTSAYGYVIPEDKYEGVVKMIGENEINMSISILIINSQVRLDHVHYLAGPTFNFRLAAIFRHPKMTGGYLALLRAFSPGLWLFAMLMWLLIAALLRLLAWTQAAVAQHTLENPEERHTWSDVMLLIVGTLAEQGSDLNSRWISWRLVFFTMLVLTVLLNNYYNASVVSSLLSLTPKNIKTLKDLIDSDLKFGAEQNHYSSKYFELDNSLLVKELYQKKMLRPRNQKPIYYTREEGVRKMLHEEFAFHIEAINVYDLIQDTFPDEEKCSLTEVEVYPPLKSYIGVPFKSALKEPVTHGMLRLGEVGILTHMNLELLPQKPTCSSEGDLISVGVVYVVPAFVILFVGVITSVLVVILERACQLKNQ